jgi:hypothetical protein
MSGRARSIDATEVEVKGLFDARKSQMGRCLVSL